MLDLLTEIYHFNPRSHEGSDKTKQIRSGLVGISIHAPTRGATPSDVLRQRKLAFQSTLPRGERPGLTRLTMDTITDFNPRSHEGSDDSVPERFKKKSISIHAPTRGATDKPDKPEKGDKDFNPRSHEGSDCNID